MKTKILFGIVGIVTIGIIFIIVCAEKGPTKIQRKSISGEIVEDQVWSGTIHVTGDINVKPGVTLTILPGTVIEVAAMSDDQHGGVDRAHDPPFPKDPDRIETQSTRIFVGGYRQY